MIVFATGFDAFSGSFLRIDIRGREGVRLADRWKDGPTAYLGLGIAGFPNLLTVNGPCNPAVLTNVPATIEHDVEWISDCIEYAERHGITAIEPTEEAEREWVQYTADARRRHAVPEGRLVVDRGQHPGQARACSWRSWAV